MKWVVAFDIVDDKRRAKVSKHLEAVSHRVQKSVFEGYFSDIEVVTLQSTLSGLIDATEDSLRLYPMDKSDDSKMILIGCSRKVEDMGYQIL